MSGSESETMAGQPFFNKIYDEALALLIEARNYIAYQERKDIRSLDTTARLLVSQETMRITCRLTQVMAWMFCQRAVQAGEMTQERALSEEFAISGEQVCLDDRWTGDHRLPLGVRSLLSRSFSLYVRVQRLEGMMRSRLAS